MNSPEAMRKAKKNLSSKHIIIIDALRIPSFLAKRCAVEAWDRDKWQVAMLNRELKESGFSTESMFSWKDKKDSMLVQIST